MIVLPSLEDFRLRYHSARKWQRCLQAIANAPRLAPGVCHSIGDTLVYRLAEGLAGAAAGFTARRRYVEIHHYLAGGETVEYAAPGELVPLAPYSDETDCATFLGKATAAHAASAGELLIFDHRHAYRPLGSAQLRKLVLLVTIEGATLHNK